MRPVGGGDGDERRRCGVIAATHRDLERAVARRQLPRGPVLPAATWSSIRGAAAARAARGHPAARRALPGAAAQRAARGAAALTPAARRRAGAPTTGRATCASSRTRSSGWWRERARRDARRAPTCRPPSANARPRSRSRSSAGCRACEELEKTLPAPRARRGEGQRSRAARFWASTAARSTAWPSASGSSSATRLRRLESDDHHSAVVRAVRSGRKRRACAREAHHLLADRLGARGALARDRSREAFIDRVVAVERLRHAVGHQQQRLAGREALRPRFVTDVRQRPPEGPLRRAPGARRPRP